ncbi:hypothetical protein RIF29_05439 [Crotalaria pallida]|uniref:Uncharacterized protein n=1 Tax=Crotalaria pallida TaxID=3830 RepID=A0AAN9J4L5_CROPI
MQHLLLSLFLQSSTNTKPSSHPISHSLLRLVVLELEACTDESRAQIVLRTSRTSKKNELCFRVCPLCTHGTYQ